MLFQKIFKWQALVAVILLFVIWFLWPVYGFYAHRKGAPMLPFGFMVEPQEDPVSQVLKDVHFKQVATQSLARLTEHRHAISAPGISAAVAIDGKLVWAGASGWADIASQKPVTPKTQFRIGSTSKALTNTLLARMVEAGEVGLDTPIENYMSLPNPEWGQLTLRQLASHRAGLPDYKDNQDLMGLYRSLALNKRYPTALSSLDVFDGSPLVNTPGTEVYYSTYNTVLLSAVLEKIKDNKPFSHVIDAFLFKPLGMDSTMAEFELKDNSELATFYWNDDGHHEQFREFRNVDLSHRLAGGGYISTPIDLVKLGSAWLDADFISQKTRQEFWTPIRMPNGEVNHQNYALGWRVKMHEGIYNANHGGVSRGAQCWLMVVPDSNLSVAVVINSNTDEFWDFGKVSMVLAQLFLEENSKPVR